MPFSDPKWRNVHSQNCINKTQAVYVKEGTVLSFNRLDATLQMRYLAFADIEALASPSEDAIDSPIINVQTPFQICYLIWDSVDKTVVHSFDYCGLNCVDIFLNDLSQRWKSISQNKPNYPISMSPNQQIEFHRQKNCQICQKTFDLVNVIKVKHHHHDIPRHNYLAALCAKCNLQVKLRSDKLKVFFHNLPYDACLILKAASDRYNFDIVRRDNSKYYSVKVNNLEFVDSNNLVKGKLSNLAVNHIILLIQAIISIFFTSSNFDAKAIYPWVIFSTEKLCFSKNASQIAVSLPEMYYSINILLIQSIILIFLTSSNFDAKAIPLGDFQY